MLDYLNLGHRLEIAPGSVVMVNVNTDEMREFPTLAAAYRAQIEANYQANLARTPRVRDPK